MLRGPTGEGNFGQVYQFPLPALQRDPSTFSKAQFFTSDFDGTKFLTDESAPGGVSVEGAYELALDEVGGPRAVDYYREQGGHRGRTPYEITAQCIPEIEESDRQEHTSRIVRIKLDHLLNNIGRPFPDGSGIWPRPTEGFADLWTLVYAARAQGALIDTADISAGHEEFLLRTYEAHNLPAPDIRVTFDTIHPLSLSTFLVTSRYAKPAPGLMQIAVDQWFELYGWAAFDDAALSTYTDRIFYTGDNEERDGGLARNSGIDFIYIPTGSSLEGWQAVASRLALGNTALRGVNAS